MATKTKRSANPRVRPLGKVKDAAARLGVSPWQYYHLIHRGVVPFTRIGPNSYRVDLDELERFIKNGGTPHRANG
jgi:excisionase family DNA binding protein